MHLIVCVDERAGMSFGGRRQSRDRALCEDMVALAEGRTLWMDPRSARLFEGLGGEIAASGEFARNAGAGECCFVEFEPVGELAERADTIVLYHWNRHYPSDLKFDVPLENRKLRGVTEFAGTSHEKITREVYVHEDE
jgi:hypothetical protein